MDIYDKIKEIQEISQEAKGYKYEPEKGMKLAFDKIIFLCEQILIDHQTQQALKKLENDQGICQTCKHWISDSDKLYWEIINPVDPDTYERMALPFEVRFCESPDLLFYERPIEPNGACVVDGSEYKAHLITGPNYSCANYEKK